MVHSVFRGRPVPDPPSVPVEIVTPRTNTAIISAAENLFAALTRHPGSGLEIAGTATGCRFLARAGNECLLHDLIAEIGVAYPQAVVRPLATADDPALLRAGEQVAGLTLLLRDAPFLPLHTYRDHEIDAQRSGQADPVLGILGACLALPAGWRALCQLIVWPPPARWSAGYARYAVEQPLAAERAAAMHGPGTSLTQVWLLLGLLVVAAAGSQGYTWYQAGDWLQLARLAAAAGIGGSGIAALALLARRLGRTPVYDRGLVAEKQNTTALLAHLRLAVFAPQDVPPTQVAARVRRLAAPYRQYNSELGNGFVERRLPLQGRDLRRLRVFSPARWFPVACPLLSNRELACLWHLPHAGADVPLLERTGPRRYLPPAQAVRVGCRIGVSSHQNRTVAVHIPPDTMRTHMLLAAHTGSGKSALLLQFARYSMQPVPAGEVQPVLILIDPHQDLARAALGLVPPEREQAVIYLDAANVDRPVGLNLLDTGLWPARDRAVESMLAVLRQLFAGFWGLRMENVLRWVLLTLYAANEAICAADPTGGRSRQYTLLDIPALIANQGFRADATRSAADPAISDWWKDYFERLPPHFRAEVVDPVLTKINRFAASLATRHILGQPRSTLSLADLLQPGRILIVNTAARVIGADTAALLGSALLNLIALQIGSGPRVPARLIVDEFHTMRGADYETILSQLAKFGAQLILATQSLSNLVPNDTRQERDLRANVFANIGCLVAYNVSAEDARYLVPELGAHIDVPDLVLMPAYHCYIRMATGGSVLPAFLVQLDPPPPLNPAHCERLAAVSAGRYGRDVREVRQDLEAARARIEAAGQSSAAWQQPGTGGGIDRGAKDPHGNGNRSSGTKATKQAGRPAGRAAPSAGVAASTAGESDASGTIQEGAVQC